MRKIVYLTLLILAAAVLPQAHNAHASLAVADRVVVIKSKRLMILMKDGEILKTYRIALGRQPLGRKVMAGDRKTPEGRYILDRRNPNSKYHLGLHVSYPNDADIANALKIGAQSGGDIMIHGLSALREPLGAMHRRQDWTDGCIAVTNAEIEEIWELVPDGTPIDIKP